MDLRTASFEEVAWEVTFSPKGQTGLFGIDERDTTHALRLGRLFLECSLLVGWADDQQTGHVRAVQLARPMCQRGRRAAPVRVVVSFCAS